MAIKRDKEPQLVSVQRELDSFQNALRGKLHGKHRETDIVNQAIEKQRQALLDVIEDEKSKLAEVYGTDTLDAQCREYQSYLAQNKEAEATQVAIDFARDLDKMEAPQSQLDTIITSLTTTENQEEAETLRGKITALLQSFEKNPKTRANATVIVKNTLFANLEHSELEQKLLESLWINTQSHTSVTYVKTTMPLTEHLTSDSPYLSVVADEKVKNHHTTYVSQDGLIQCHKSIPYIVKDENENAWLTFTQIIDTTYDPKTQTFTQVRESIRDVTSSPRSEIDRDLNHRLKQIEKNLKSRYLASEIEAVLTQAKDTIEQAPLKKEDIRGWKKLLLNVLSLLKKIGIHTDWIIHEKKVLETKIKTPVLRK